MTARALPLVLLLLAAQGVPGQQGGVLPGTNARSLGRGTTSVGVAEDGDALVHNPAGLVQSESEWRLEVALALYHSRLSYRDPWNPARRRSEATDPAPAFTLTWDPDPGSRGAGDLRLALGLLHLEGHRSDLDLSTQDFQPPLRTKRKTDYLHTGVHMGAAVRVTGEVAFGATLSATYSTLTAGEPLEVPVFAFQGESPLGTPWGQLLYKNFGVEALRIEGVFDGEPVYGAALTLGMLWEPSPEFQAGLAFRPPAWSGDYRGKVDVDISRIFGEPDPVTFPDGFAVSYRGRLEGLGHPAVAGVGFAWMPAPSLRLSLDIRWTGWAGSHRKTRLHLRDGDNPGFNAFAGGDRLLVEQELRFRNQTTVALGVEWEFEPGWKLRAGGWLQESPVGNASATPAAPAFATAAMTLGIGYESDGFSVDAAWMRAFPATRRVDDSIVSSDLDSSRQTIATDVFLVSVAWRF